MTVPTAFVFKNFRERINDTTSAINRPVMEKSKKGTTVLSLNKVSHEYRGCPYFLFINELSYRYPWFLTYKHISPCWNLPLWLPEFPGWHGSLQWSWRSDYKRHLWDRRGPGKPGPVEISFKFSWVVDNKNQKKSSWRNLLPKYFFSGNYVVKKFLNSKPGRIFYETVFWKDALFW